MQNLKYFGWPIPEYTTVAKIVLLFTDHREVHPLKDACTEVSFNSGFFCRGVLTTAASVEAASEDSHTLGFAVIHLCWQSRLCVRGKSHLCQHSSCHRIHTGRNYTAKMTLERGFFSFWKCHLRKCLGNLCFLSLLFSLQ